MTVNNLNESQRETQVRLHGLSDEVVQSSKVSLKAVETMKHIEKTFADSSLFYDCQYCYKLLGFDHF